MTLGSLFDGIGGFPLAAQRLGITPVWASEIEPAPVIITKRHFPDMAYLGDITKIDGAGIAPVDIITFGSPCQDLSVAGKRAGIGGERSGLFMQAIRIIREMRCATDGQSPAIIVWENVPGAFSSNRGEDFRTVLEEIARAAEPGISIPRPPGGVWQSAGAMLGNGWSVAWRVLDAQYWGVPQRRRRIFLVGDFTGGRAAEILFKPEGLRGDIAASAAAREGAAAGAGGGVEGTNGGGGCLTPWDVQSKRIYTTSGVAPTVCACNGIGGKNPVGLVITENAGGGADAAGFDIQQITRTLRAAASGTSQAPSVAYACQTAQTGQNGRGISEEIAYTLDQSNGQAVACTGTWPDKAYTLLARHDSSPTPGQLSGICCVATGQAGAEMLDNQSPTLNCNHEQPYICGAGHIVRRLTPVECERLQGFPDGWTAHGHDGKPISDSARYKAIGNSVALPCVEYVLAGAREVLEKEVWP